MAKKYLDKDGLIYYDGLMKQKLGDKVDKVDGKGLSTNDFDNTASSNVIANTQLRHTHDNKKILDDTTASYTEAEKTKLAGLENYSLPTASTTEKGGVIVGAGLSISNGVLSANGGGTADSVEWSNVQNKPTKLSDFDNDGVFITMSQVEGKGYQTSGQVTSAISTATKDFVNGTTVDNKISTAIASAYKASGSIAFANLPELKEANLGNVYNITDDFTTNTNFVEGANKKYSAGTNVAIVKVGNNYKYDVMSSFVDLTNYVTTSDFETITTDEIDAIVG